MNSEEETQLIKQMRKSLKKQKNQFNDLKGIDVFTDCQITLERIKTSIGWLLEEVFEGGYALITSRTYKLSKYYEQTTDFRINSNIIKPYPRLVISKKKPNRNFYKSINKKFRSQYKRSYITENGSYLVFVDWKDESTGQLVISSLHRFRVLYQAKAFAYLLKNLDFKNKTFAPIKKIGNTFYYSDSEAYLERLKKNHLVNETGYFRYNIVDDYLYYYLIPESKNDLI